MMSLSPVWHIGGPFSLAARLNGIERLIMNEYRKHKMNMSIKRECTPEDQCTIPRHTEESDLFQHWLEPTTPGIGALAL